LERDQVTMSEHAPHDDCMTIRDNTVDEKIWSKLLLEFCYFEWSLMQWKAPHMRNCTPTAVFIFPIKWSICLRYTPSGLPQ
jgi:hypothetical protein